MLTVETFVCKAFRTHAHTKQPTIQNSTSALWLLLLRLLLLCKGGQLFPNVHAAVTLAWFPNNNNVTQTFHRSKSDQNITLAGKEGGFWKRVLWTTWTSATRHITLWRRSLYSCPAKLHYFSLEVERPKLTPGALLLPISLLPTELNFLVCMLCSSEARQAMARREEIGCQC